MQPDEAIERYKERRVRDAQAPIGATEFDDLAASDSDTEESNPGIRELRSQILGNDDLSGMGTTDEELTAATAMLELAQSGAPPTVPSGPSDASGYDSDASTVGFPTPPQGVTISPGSPLYDDDDRTPAEMGLVPFSPRFYETPDRDNDMSGEGYLSYPGEGLVKDGLSYVGNAMFGHGMQLMADPRTAPLTAAQTATNNQLDNMNAWAHKHMGTPL
jgi:hypothetical protein